MSDSNVISFMSGRPAVEVTSSGEVRDEVEKKLHQEAIELVEDLKQRMINGEIVGFSFIGFSEDGMNDVTAVTTGTFKNPAYTVGAMEMHKQDFIKMVDNLYLGDPADKD